MNNDDLIWLMNWYYHQCDGDWEHDSGIHIGTIDNPGWSISINIKDTELEEKQFQVINIENSSNDWYTCFIKHNRFEGRCGPLLLPKILSIFCNWAKNQSE